MSNFQHQTLTPEDMSIADAYLRGENEHFNPIIAHRIIKSIYAAGKLRNPTIYARAKRYVTDNYEYEATEKLSNCPERTYQQ